MKKSNINIRCRNCQSKNNFKDLFSLGKLSFTGKFPKQKKINIPKAEINLVICSKCKLVQVSKNFNLKYMYDQNYGYRTGINKTMKSHVKDIVNEVCRNLNILKKNDLVLDIASNDGTLLNFYNNDVLKIGVDPLVNKYKKFYNKIDYKFSNFFSRNLIKKTIKKKIKVITALSVFYDLKNPNNFLKDISKIIEPNFGILILEHTDLLSIIKKNLFDTICHEHLAYYSANVIISIINKNNLKVFDIKKNNINGGSTRFYIAHKLSRHKVKNIKISNILKEEFFYKLDQVKTYKIFYNKILTLRENLKKILLRINNSNSTIHGYGASTKGNVLLQFFNIDNKILPRIADRNPLKNNCYTPGTKIKIISERTSRLLKPDYYLVLPWHFKNEILSREKKIRSKGCKFIFPLPEVNIC
jgi:hypothetical protein